MQKMEIKQTLQKNTNLMTNVMSFVVHSLLRHNFLLIMLHSLYNHSTPPSLLLHSLSCIFLPMELIHPHQYSKIFPFLFYL